MMILDSGLLFWATLYIGVLMNDLSFKWSSWAIFVL